MSVLASPEHLIEPIALRSPSRREAGEAGIAGPADEGSRDGPPPGPPQLSLGL